MNLRDRKLVFVLVAVAAAVIAGILIGVSVLGSSSDKSSAPETQTAEPVRTLPVEPDGGAGTTPAPTKVPGAAATIALFKGIPQKLNVVGKTTAPATMIEFADLQCPYCRDYALNALPELVTKYVRTGKVKFVFSGMHFLGPDSDKALRAVYAAGIQGHLWEALDLLYKSQGPENSGWVTDDLLRSVGASIPGFDTEKMFADMTSPEVIAAVEAADQQAQKASVSSTPTFFAGPTGSTLQHIDVAALTPQAFTPTLDALVK
jgi:protein-disulfide isomerase